MLVELEGKINTILSKIIKLKNQKDLNKFNYKINSLSGDLDQIDYYIDDLIYSIKNSEKKLKKKKESRLLI